MRRGVVSTRWPGGPPTGGSIHPSWQPTIAGTTLACMDTANTSPGDRSRALYPETEAERQHRLARETDARNTAGAERRRRLTLKGLADVDAGRLIDDEAMEAWADSLGTDQELPPPQPA